VSLTPSFEIREFTEFPVSISSRSATTGSEEGMKDGGGRYERWALCEKGLTTKTGILRSHQVFFMRVFFFCGWMSS
jgi:hypothetical protein